LIIMATFHTHPHSGPRFVQEPSPTDILAVHGDPNLSHPEYEGEYVISRRLIYLIRRDGSVETVGDTSSLLKMNGGKTP
jgi:hypothetical protein